ncbi:type II toxin-antitoxin system RelE/ParE family toxin [Nonlabens ponticola]|uniref:Type II toxin-antitoxin system RelE/ParE family toxin n=1 Tax=Nonlabens ponticola TaxID=2496866 RepID=A0A3S9MUG7_9FLAO|nr:type II toxin-antitoxin system RelE/ParE family toxin [Nonlabens ponticola]AZQ42826.1 type II toxin-antitoxin system RelE/ParE family toxin [Nonlabens ponticola]
MAGRNVIWTKTADIQFIGILEYWVRRNNSKSYSIKLIEKVEDYTNKIAIDPLLFQKTSFQNTRMAVLGNYSIFYQFTDSDVIIMAFWDNRQDPKKLLAVLRTK